MSLDFETATEALFVAFGHKVLFIHEIDERLSQNGLQKDKWDTYGSEPTKGSNWHY